MQVFKVDPENPEPETIYKAARVLHLGGLVAYPTETLYGLGANVMDMGAIQRVFEAKGRPEGKPVSMAFRDVWHAEKFAIFNDDARRLAEFMMPGPLTLILPARVNMGDMFGGEKMSVRIPSDPVAQALLKSVKFPITATSANLSGKADPTCAQDVIEQIGEKVDIVLDSGKCEHSRPSTVVDLSEGKVNIVREGAIPRSRIVSYLEARQT